MPYLGDAPEGEFYAEAVRLAEMVADSDPSAPQLLFEPAVATCGQSLHLSGRRFPVGKYVLRYSGGSRVIAVAEAGANGAFDLDTTVVYQGCANHYANGQPMAIHALSAVAGPVTAWQNLNSLVEIGFGPLAGAADGPFTDLRVAPNPARCSDTLTITGGGFVPGERLNVAVGEGIGDGAVTVDSSGVFETRRAIPAGACKDQMIRMTATQVGFEEYTPPFMSLAETTLFRDGTPPLAPGPPDVGTGPPGAETDGHAVWREVGLVCLALALLGTVTFRHARKGPR